MANIKLYYRNGFYCIDNGDGVKYIDPVRLDLKDLNDGRVRIIYDTIRGATVTAEHLYSEVQGEDGVSYGSTMEKVLEGVSRHSDVVVNDQTTDAIIAKMSRISNQTTLSAAGSIGDRTITLTSATGAVDAKYIVLFHPASERFSTFYKVGAAVGNVITLDTPLDFDYPAGTFVDIADTNMNVNGSVTPQIFGLRNSTETPEGVDIAMDVTRILIGCKTDSAVDLAKFGDIPRLVNGLVMRKIDGKYKNLWNCKSNGELAGIAYDFTVYQATNPTQGQDGFMMRLTFASQGKMGVAIRLEQGEDLQVIVQDDLTLLDRLTIVAEGHIVDKS